MSKQSYFVIIGRIPEEENETHLYGPCDRRTALRCFEADLYEGTDRSRASVKRDHAVTVYYEAIIRCTSKPHIEQV